MKSDWRGILPQFSEEDLDCLVTDLMEGSCCPCKSRGAGGGGRREGREGEEGGRDEDGEGEEERRKIEGWIKERKEKDRESGKKRRLWRGGGRKEGKERKRERKGG